MCVFGAEIEEEDDNDDDDDETNRKFAICFCFFHSRGGGHQMAEDGC